MWLGGGLQFYPQYRQRHLISDTLVRVKHLLKLQLMRYEMRHTTKRPMLARKPVAIAAPNGVVNLCAACVKFTDKMARGGSLVKHSIDR